MQNKHFLVQIVQKKFEEIKEFIEVKYYKILSKELIS